MGKRPFPSSGEMYLGRNANRDRVEFMIHGERMQEVRRQWRSMDIDTEQFEYYAIWLPFVYGIGSEPI